MKVSVVIILMGYLSSSFLAQQTASTGNQQSNSSTQQGQSTQTNSNNQSGQQGKAGQKGQGTDQKTAPITCNNDILRSYMLRGRFNSEPEKMLTCPTIKNSCCTKLDQQRIYHAVNDLLPDRILEYQNKMRMALVKIKQFHEKIIQNRPFFKGRPNRRSFCGTAARKLYNFPFLTFYDKIIEDLEGARLDTDSYYQTFFCNLCDADNHQYIALKTKQIAMHGEFCQTFLKQNQDIIQMLNVELVEYLQSVQNVVDCVHYSKSYNLKFFNEEKVKFAAELGQCLNNVSSPNFLKKCASTCKQIFLSKITFLFEGDFEFLMDAVNIFEDFFKRKEDGNFISMKLRLFFKKFVIPRKLSKAKKARFLIELRKREAVIAQRRLKQIGRNLSKSRESVIESQQTIQSNTQTFEPNNQVYAHNNQQFLPNNEQYNDANNIKNVKRSRNDEGPEERNLVQIDKDNIKKTKKMINTTKQIHITDGRVLSTEGNGANNTTSQQNSQNNSTGNSQNNRQNRLKKVKKAKLIYNKELFKFYSEIRIRPPSEKVYIFKTKAKPIDIDKLNKTVSMNNGINTTKFFGNTKFNIPNGVFYRQLFSYRKPDQPDPNLLLFLSEFTVKLLQDLTTDVSVAIKLEHVKNKHKKNGTNNSNSQKSNNRVLSLNKSTGKLKDNNLNAKN